MHMRVSLTVIAAGVAVALAIPAAASAQVGTGSDKPSFLVAGMAQRSSQPGSNRGKRDHGFGIGVKGGLLFSSLNQAGQSYKNNNGWEAGMFFGGNRNGTVGVMADVLYAKKGAKSGSTVLNNYYLEIPILLRVNIGSANKNSGAIVYGLGGPAFDILLKSQLDGVDVKSKYESLDMGVLVGAGVEVSRFLVEGRYNIGIRNVAKASGAAATDVKSRSFAVLAGVRFN